MNWVTVHRYKGVAIQTRSEATPDQFGYRVDHPELIGILFGTVQTAAAAIDRQEKAK